MAVRQSDTDPRSDAPTALEPGIAPVVALPRQGLPRSALIALALAAAVILFLILEGRRQSLNQAPAVESAGSSPVSAPPPLYVPGQQPQNFAYQGSPVRPARPYAPGRPVTAAAAQEAPVFRSAAAAAPVYVPAQPTYMPPPAPQDMLQPQRGSGESVLVIDNTGAAGTADGTGASSGGSAAAGTAVAATRSRAGSFENPSTTIPQGTLIPAVLETGLDSTWPGIARAVISRDIRGFDGTRVLVPRGSRLVGEYRSDASLGQRRAMINWTRLIRPDGATLAIGSPAADSAGRVGVPARVNTHFLQRLGSALLQSMVSLGTGFAGRRSDSTVVINTSGAAQGVGALTQTQQPTPTLTVRPGTSISVLVARDLDFTPVERSR